MLPAELSPLVALAEVSYQPDIPSWTLIVHAVSSRLPSSVVDPLQTIRNFGSDENQLFAVMFIFGLAKDLAMGTMNIFQCMSIRHLVLRKPDSSLMRSGVADKSEVDATSATNDSYNIENRPVKRQHSD